MSKQSNIEATQRFGAAVKSGDYAAFDQIVAPDSIDHDPAPGQGPGPDGFKRFFGDMRAAFPDLNIEVEHMVADDDNVSFAYKISGTHQGPFQGVAPTGKRIEARGMQISRFQDGKMVERWGSSDELTIMKQIGAIEG